MIFFHKEERGGGVLPYSLGGGVPLGSRKSYPLLDQILQILWPSTRPKMLNYAWPVFKHKCLRVRVMAQI